jgi:hypothetical protein
MGNPEFVSEGGDGVDQLQTGPHRPLGVVLVADLGSPKSGDGVAYELVDLSAEALDDLTGPIEVAGE